MSKIITIIDYGSGNLKSVFNAINIVSEDYQIIISSNPKDLKRSDKIILPGVGAFPDCIDNLRKIPEMIDVLKEEILQNNKYFLGICVGMQLLADYGYEHKKTEGLSLISGNVVKIDVEDKSLKIPHIGWNNIDIYQDHKILNNIRNNEHFYFVHSYYFKASDQNNIMAKFNYGHDMSAIINKDNIIATQFHPEKSATAGQKLLKNFLNL